MTHNTRMISLYSMVMIYITAGILHFIQSSFYVALIPSFIPFPFFCVVVSGVVEIVLGTLLLFPRHRAFSAWMIIAMLIIYAILVHIPMMMDYYKTNDPHMWIAVLRLPIQGALIWWAWKFTRKQKYAAV